MDHVAGRQSKVESTARVNESTAPAVGKQTLVESLVQYASGEGGAEGPETVHAHAAAGTAGASSALPHGDRIQRLFGAHDIGGVRAHTDGAAAQANAAMGSKAYARGNDVAFGSSPDLHTAAHEAAHVVQQRGEVQLKDGVGASGDRYEQHADAVADKVVAGESAEALLSTVVAPGATGGAGAVQHAVQFEGKPSSEKPFKFTEFTFAPKLPKAETSVGFITMSLAPSLQFKGSVGVKDSDDTKVTATGLIPAAKTVVQNQLDADGSEFTFEDGGWVNFEELAISSTENGPGKGNIGKVTFYKGQLKRGKNVLGEVKLSVAALSWDGLTWDGENKDKKIKLFPLEGTAEVNFLTVAAQVDLGGGVLAADGKVTGGLKGTVAVDPVKLGLMLAKDVALGAGMRGLVTALPVFGAQVLAPLAAGVAVGITVAEILDELDVDNITQQAFTDANRASTGFENEMKQPGHAYKPSILFRNDPYQKGVEAASGLKSQFFAAFLAHPKLGQWRKATPDPAQQQSSMDAAYRQWIAQDAPARSILTGTASRMKIELNTRIMGDHFVPYANRQGLFSRRERILRLFEQLWPGALWLDPISRLKPIAYPATIPRPCYMIASQLSPVAYPADLSRWMQPPTLI